MPTALPRDSADADDDDDVPAILQPIRADIRFITIEYSLWNGRWWLPRLVALDGLAEVGRFPSVPFRFERGYTLEEVSGGTAAPRVPIGRASSARCPGGRRRTSVTVGTSGMDVDVSSAADSARVADSDSAIACTCRAGRCHRFAVDVPEDTASLLTSEHLPPSIYGSDETLVTGEDVGRLTEELRDLAPAPWGFESPVVQWSVASLDLLRYNRVEGLSIGARASADFGVLIADVTGRIGVPEGEPLVEAGVERQGLNHDLRLAGYHRLAQVNPDARGFGLGNSLGSLLFGRDDGDYFRASGVELIGRPAPTTAQWYSWRLYGEAQRSVAKNTDFSAPHLFDGAEEFRPVLGAQRADQFGTELSLSAQRGLNPVGWRGAAKLDVRAETGDFRFARPALTLFGSAPLPASLLGSLELSGGTSTGNVPLQGLWLLGGASTVRGYGSATAIGDAFWRSRAEIATERPGGRLILFSDAGWAGDRDRISFSDDDMLLSAGVGVGFLDGLVRLDLARTLRQQKRWGLSLYVGRGL